MHTPFWRRRFAIALAGVAAIIIYGSLYPFDFAVIEFPGGPLHALLSTWPERNALGDTLANILLYVPFGFCAVLCFRAPRVPRVLFAITAGIALSGCMEFLQLYDQGRWATMADIRSNTAGAVLGTIGGLAFDRIWKSRRSPRLPFQVQPFLILLLACWAGYRLFPYVPVIDLHKYWYALQPLFKPEFSAVALCRHLTVWLAVAMILEEMCGGVIGRTAPILLFAGTLCARILIEGVVLSLSEVAGGILAILLWVFWLSQVADRIRWVAGLFVFNLLVQGLYPFQFSARGHTFSWIPFYSLMAAEPQAGVQSFFEKTFIYGTLLWLFRRSDFSYKNSVLIASALIIAITFLAVLLKSRTW